MSICHYRYYLLLTLCIGRNISLSNAYRSTNLAVAKAVFSNLYLAV